MVQQNIDMSEETKLSLKLKIFGSSHQVNFGTIIN